MTDLATLGIVLDSSSVVKAKTDLDALPGAAQRAERGVDRLANHFGKLQLQLAQTASQQEQMLSAMLRVSEGTNRSTRATASYEAELQRMQRALDQYNRATAATVKSTAGLTTSTGLARHELINFSRQAQDVGVTIAAGQNPMTILIQQGSQIADIFASSKGTLHGFGQQVASIITPMRLLSLGIFAVVAVAAIAVFSWRSFALALDDTAKRAGMASGEMSKLQAAASFKGIDNAEFSKGMASFADDAYRAQINIGSLSVLLRENGMRANGTADAFEKIADLVLRAKNETHKYIILQQAGLPATAQWVRLLEKGAEGIRKAKDGATAFGGAVNDEMVATARKFEERWNAAWNSFSHAAKNAVNDSMDWIDKLIDKAEKFRQKGGLIGWTLRQMGAYEENTPTSPPKRTSTEIVADRFPGAGETFGRLKQKVTTVNPEEIARQIALQERYLSLMGQTATVEQIVEGTKRRVNQAIKEYVPLSDTEAENLIRLAREQANGVTQTTAQTDAMRIHTATVGMSAGAAAEYVAVQTKLAEARRNGAPLDAASEEALRKEAAALGAVTQAAALKHAQKQATFKSKDAVIVQDNDLAPALKKAA